MLGPTDMLVRDITGPRRRRGGEVGPARLLLGDVTAIALPGWPLLAIATMVPASSHAAVLEVEDGYDRMGQVAVVVELEGRAPRRRAVRFLPSPDTRLTRMVRRGGPRTRVSNVRAGGGLSRGWPSALSRSCGTVEVGLVLFGESDELGVGEVAAVVGLLDLVPVATGVRIGGDAVDGHRVTE